MLCAWSSNKVHAASSVCDSVLPCSTLYTISVTYPPLPQWRWSMLCLLADTCPPRLTMTYSAYGVNDDAANELYLHRQRGPWPPWSMGLFKNHITHIVVDWSCFFKYFVFIFTLYDLIVINSELTFVENKAIVLNGNWCCSLIYLIWYYVQSLFRQCFSTTSYHFQILI